MPKCKECSPYWRWSFYQWTRPKELSELLINFIRKTNEQSNGTHRIKISNNSSAHGWILRSQCFCVCNAGGFGVEASSGEVDNCKAEIEKMSELTDQPFGVNLPLLFLKMKAWWSSVFNMA